MLCELFGTRMINDWNNLTSDILTIIFMTSNLCFIVNVFNVIIINVDNFVCVLLYVIERVYRLLSLNPEYNHNA